MRIRKNYIAGLALVLMLFACFAVPSATEADAAFVGEISEVNINLSMPPVVCGEVTGISASLSTRGCSLGSMTWYDMYGQLMTGTFDYDNATVVITVNAAPGYYFSGNVRVGISGAYAAFENYGSQLVVSKTYSPVVWAPNIVKHPVSETKFPGGLASFVSYAAFTNESHWTIIDTEGKHYSVQSIAEKFPGVAFYSEYSKLNIGPLPVEMNGYKVRCTFTGPGGSVDSGYAEIVIVDPGTLSEVTAAQTPAATPHKHAFSDELTKDAGYHWYPCECGETKDRQAHRYTWTQRRAATAESPGLVQGECSVCGYVLNCRTQLDPAEAEKLKAEAEAKKQAEAAPPSPEPPKNTEPPLEEQEVAENMGKIFSFIQKITGK